MFMAGAGGGLLHVWWCKGAVPVPAAQGGLAGMQSMLPGDVVRPVNVGARSDHYEGYAGRWYWHAGVAQRLA